MIIGMITSNDNYAQCQAAPEGRYTGAIDVLKQLLKKEGPVALYKGCVPILLRSIWGSGHDDDGGETIYEELLIEEWEA